MSIFPDDTWTVGTADQDGQPLVIRVRSQMPAAAERQRHAHLVVVGWPYDGADTGLPTTEDDAAMQAFEDAVASGAERGGTGIQVASITGAGRMMTPRTPAPSRSCGPPSGRVPRPRRSPNGPP